MLILYLSILSTESEKNEFESLYLKYGDGLLRYAYGKVRDPHHAEDIAHDTWLFVAEHFEKLQGLDEISLKNYIFKIVHHKCVDLFRKQKTTAALSEAIASKITEHATADEEEILFSICQKETANTIVSCIKQLDACYRDVLNLYYFNENTTREIAEILKLKDGTVRQRLSRGRQKLIDLLEKYKLEYEIK